MKVTLKSLAQIEKEFKDISTRWEYRNGDLYIFINDNYWFISASTRNRFGKEIEVERRKGIINYTHMHFGVDGYIDMLLHESWFQPEGFAVEGFFGKEEFEI